MSDWEDVKKNVGNRAAELVRSGMSIGLGTGSTARFVIEALAEKKRSGLNFKAVATSKESEALGKKHGIDFVDPKEVCKLDLCIDGADEITPDHLMIKGRGGALWREKIVAKMSKQMIVIVDETKLVDQLGQKAKLPIELALFGMKATACEIEQLGYVGTFRKNGDNLYLTDSGNVIFDLEQKVLSDPKTLHTQLLHIPGVIETGLFFDLPIEAYVGFKDGRVEKH
jgi:ribose 5-phosphate isomerase A